MLFVGVDGCKRGWFYVSYDGLKLHGNVVESLSDLVSAVPDGTSIMVDIPIGLRDDNRAPRLCDTEARKVLGPGRASSVFPSPIRAILNEPSHVEASKKSRQLAGTGISQQAFAIIPKIREVDELLAQSERARDSVSVREIHPEVCFWALNGRLPMANKKKSEAGFAQRIALIESYLNGAKELVAQVLDDYLRKEVAKDDIADALVALITAMGPPSEQRTLPAEPELDSRGLPMEMVFRTTSTENFHSQVSNG